MAPLVLLTKHTRPANFAATPTHLETEPVRVPLRIQRFLAYLGLEARIAQFNLKHSNMLFAPHTRKFARSGETLVP